MATAEIIVLAFMCLAALMVKRYTRRNSFYRKAVKRSYDAWKRSRKIRYY